jgi:hypothetical protein
MYSAVCLIRMNNFRSKHIIRATAFISQVEFFAKGAMFHGNEIYILSDVYFTVLGGA